jgi:RimJ/RimL family protein N-acetyltransferase
VTAPIFTFRELTAGDIPRLHEWLNRPHVAEWWGDDVSFAAVDRDVRADLASPFITPFLACLGGEPVGFIQAYVVMSADPDWWQDERDPGARGIDQFLADESQLGQGLGSAMVAQFVARLFEDPGVTKVQTDPSPENGRAIRAYEKAGFRRVETIDTPDGPALVMVVRRSERAGA